MTQVVVFADFHQARGTRNRCVYFNRAELMVLLQLYSRRVACGEWRDYAIDHTIGLAAFTVFRHSFDHPVLTITKTTSQTGRTTEYTALIPRRKIRSASSLNDLLTALERQPELISHP